MSSVRVLLIEADELRAGRVRKALLKTDAIVQRVHMLAEGVALLRDRFDYLPHVIVLDSSLPDGEGVPMIAAVLKECGTVPIVLLNIEEEHSIAMRKGVYKILETLEEEPLREAVLGAANERAIPVELEWTDSEVQSAKNRVMEIMES